MTMPNSPPNSRKPTPKKTWYILGGAGVLVFVVVWYSLRRKSAASAASSNTTDLASAGIDPTTGQPYSSEYGYGGGAYGTTPSLYGFTDPSTGAFITGSGAGGSFVTQPTTNAQWAQMAEAYLQQLGNDPIVSGAALGKYLIGAPLTPDQLAIVQSAIGFFGMPPGGAPPILNIGPVGQGGGSTPILPATAPYTVTGRTNPVDMYPGGVAIAAYKIPKSDTLDISYYATIITLENPGVSPPYPVGTVIKVPINPNKTTHTSPYP